MTTTRSRNGAFTLVELMVATAVFATISLITLRVVGSGAVLYAKNMAINVAHDQSRIAVARLVHDIHGAVSVPTLGHIDKRTPGTWAAPANSWVPYGTNVTFVPDTGAGPSAGVSFQVLGDASNHTGGPFQVTNDPGNQNLIQIDSGTSQPTPGMRLIFPYYNLEDDITQVTSNGANHYNVWTKNAHETLFKQKKDTFSICYYTSRYAYVVENGELHLYSSAPPPNNVSWPATLARNIINATDRTKAATPFTASDTQYVGVNISTEDQHYTNRSYKAVNTLIAGSIPYYSKITVYQ